MEHFAYIQTWLSNSYNIKVSPDWLSACLEWIAQESGGQVQSADVLKQQVFEQWLTSDLAEIGEASLPADAATCDKIELISNYALQIISIVDVGFPLYGQQQKLMGRENVNSEVSADKPFQPAWEPKQSRMLLLTLTDGHSEIKAMEYQPIRALHSHLPSGTKCVLSGTVLCRRGMVLLTEEHIQVLGGEVDTLSEVNTPLNILQQVMEKSHEDAGKRARQEFSGKFITRGCNKKLDVMKKTSMIKKEGSGSSFQHSSNFQAPSQAGMKKEMKPVISSSVRKVKAEIFKSEQNRNDCSLGSGKKFKTEEEWGEDINYSELFDNDMDFDEGFQTHQNNRRSDKDSSRIGIKSELCNNSQTSRLRTAQRNDLTSMKSSQILAEEPISKEDVIGVFDDDEDMDIENVLGDSSPSWNPCVPNSSSQKDRSDVLKSDRGSAKIDKPKAQTLNPAFISAKQELWAQNTENSFPKISNQHEQTELRAQPKSPTFRSPASTTTQVSLTVIQPTSKPKQILDHKRATSQTGVSQAKKPKVQAKLSDLFSKQSKVAVKSSESKEGKFPASGGLSASGLPCDELLIGNSGDKDSAPDMKERFSNKKTSPVPSQHTLEKPLAPDTISKMGQDLKGLPRAVIQPFKPASRIDQGGDDSSHPQFKHLSDLHSSTAEPITVKVSILTLIEKLCSNNGSHWSLACKVNDGVTSLDLDISNGVLTRLIGFSAEDSIAMRQRFKSEPQVKEVFAEGLSLCQSKLMSGRGGCVVEIVPASLNLKGKRPVMVNLNLQPG